MRFFLSNVLVLTMAARGLGDVLSQKGLPTGHLRQVARSNEDRELGANPTVSSLFCSSDKDCDSTMYCASGECLEMGACDTNIDCRNPSNMYAVIECTGPLLCFEDKRCGRECGPVCDDGTKPTEQQCDVVPCEIVDDICLSSGIVSCQNDYCTGCNALVFDDAGYHELCVGPVKPAESTPCNSTRDCALDGSEYCSRGTCTTSGQCSSDADCFNPNNVYATIACVGPLSCFDNGQCGRTCAESECPADIADISPECSSVSCDGMGPPLLCGEIASCVDYTCGGCESFVFDQAGFPVVKKDALNNVTTAACETSSDCAASQYCQQGVCAEMGQCFSHADCFNPENVYATIFCVGPLSCFDNGFCGITCDESSCPANATDVSTECSSVPCDELDESMFANATTTCVNYTCGDCESFIFDPSGFAIYQLGISNTTECVTSADCDTAQYCQQGVCAEAGECSTDADCFNPENIFATIACVGPLSCSDDGQCGRTCSDSDCPSNAADISTECSILPCDSMAELCAEGYTSCVDYSCGDCKSFAFDPSGSSVCQVESQASSTRTCESSSDCIDSQYCQQGICAEMGHCLSDADCFNMDNQYAVILCIGPLSCNSDNQCGVTCSDSNCPADTPEVQCLVSPCSVVESSCSDEVSSCVDNYCGDCIAYAFDKAGNRVCQA